MQDMQPATGLALEHFDHRGNAGIFGKGLCDIGNHGDFGQQIRPSAGGIMLAGSQAGLGGIAPDGLR